MARAKQLIGKIMRSKGEVFTVADAAICLDLSSDDTAKTLARWAKQGWLMRLKRGLYAVVAIDASSTERVLAEPWVLIPQLFKSCYVGGWSAAEHWGLTEQIFYDICVVSDSARVKKTHRVQNINFVATKVSSERLFGSKVIWKNNTKVMVSDPHKTIVDMLYDPLLGGGIQFPSTWRRNAVAVRRKPCGPCAKPAGGSCCDQGLLVLRDQGPAVHGIRFEVPSAALDRGGYCRLDLDPATCENVYVIREW